MRWSLAALVIGFCIDLLLGDPHGFPHPVILIGKLIGRLEQGLRRLFPKTVRGEQIAGGVLWLLVVLFSTAARVTPASSSAAVSLPTIMETAYRDRSISPLSSA